MLVCLLLGFMWFECVNAHAKNRVYFFVNKWVWMSVFMYVSVSFCKICITSGYFVMMKTSSVSLVIIEMKNWRKMSSLPEVCFMFIIVEIWISNKISSGSIEIECEKEMERERVCVCVFANRKRRLLECTEIQLVNTTKFEQLQSNTVKQLNTNLIQTAHFAGNAGHIPKWDWTKSFIFFQTIQSKKN